MYYQGCTVVHLRALNVTAPPAFLLRDAIKLAIFEIEVTKGACGLKPALDIAGIRVVRFTPDNVQLARMRRLQLSTLVGQPCTVVMPPPNPHSSL